MKSGHHDIVINDYISPTGQKFLVFNSNSVSCSFPYDKTVLEEIQKLITHLIKKESSDDKVKKQDAK